MLSLGSKFGQRAKIINYQAQLTAIIDDTIEREDGCLKRKRPTLHSSSPSFISERLSSFHPYPSILQ
jgi:hypothetical protein